jgi:outer membrane protein assembly factor BamD (BamD/ComL family)
LGRKRNRTRKYLYFSVAGVILISIAGCAALQEIEQKREAREHLITAQKLLQQRDYAGCLTDSQKALSLYDHTPPADEALFNAALVHAHYGSSKRDYRKSLDLFKRLVNGFPQSPLAGQAAIWIEVLQENERSKGELEELNKGVKESSQENQRLHREIEELNKTIRKSKQIDIEIEEKKKELSK